VGLDYTSGCVNLRDVGELLDLIGGVNALAPRTLLRGGKIDFVSSGAQLMFPGTIVNLRKGPDPTAKLFGADHFHFPISNRYEKYDTTLPEVRKWLNDVLDSFAQNVERLPVLYHCTSGKDRTGVVIAVLLTVLGVARRHVVDEYMWRDGDVDVSWINQALDGIGDPELYFKRVDLGEVRRKLATGVSR